MVLCFFPSFLFLPLAFSLPSGGKKRSLQPNVEKRGLLKKKNSMAKGGRDYGCWGGSFGCLTGSGLRLGLLTPIRLSGVSGLGKYGSSGVCTEGGR